MDDIPRAFMTIELLSQAQAKLKLLHILADWKRLIWTVMSLMFLGSLRGSKLLAKDRVKFDPLKSVFGEDLKLAVIKAQGRTRSWLRCRISSMRTTTTPGGAGR